MVAGVHQSNKGGTYRMKHQIFAALTREDRVRVLPDILGGTPTLSSLVSFNLRVLVVAKVVN